MGFYKGPRHKQKNPNAINVHVPKLPKPITFRVTQSIGDIKVGIRKKDLSRISIYGGDKGLHTGNRSSTTGRHGKPFITRRKKY